MPYAPLPSIPSLSATVRASEIQAVRIGWPDVLSMGQTLGVYTHLGWARGPLRLPPHDLVPPRAGAALRSFPRNLNGMGPTSNDASRMDGR